MIYLVLAVLFLYLISIPLVVTADIDIDYDHDYGTIKFKLWFFTVYKKPVNIKAFKQKIEGMVEDGDRSSTHKKKDSESIKKHFPINLIKHVAERVRIRDIDFQLRLGTGDAAVSAFIVGMIKISYESVCAFWGIDKEKALIEPIYDNEYIFLDFFGIFSLSFADIIYAVCATLLSSIPQRRRYANTVTE